MNIFSADITSAAPVQLRREIAQGFAAARSSAVLYICDVHDDRAVRFISPNVEAITGHKALGFIAQGDFRHRHVHPDDLAGYKASRQALNYSGSLCHEYRLATPTGEYRWFRDQAERTDALDGSARIIGCMVDITAEKASEAEQNETLEDAIAALSEGFALYDADDRLVAYNAQAETFAGRNADLFKIGECWSDIARSMAERGMFAAAAGRIEEWLAERSAIRGSTVNEEIRLSDGRWFAYAHRSTRRGGRVTTWRDISDRKQLEQARRDSEELVHHVLEACPVPITMNTVDDGIVLYESPATLALLKYDEPQIGTSVIDRWSDPSDRMAYLTLLREQGGVDALEARYTKADGTVFPCALSSRLIDYRGVEVIVSTLVDLTEHRAMECALRASEEHFRSIVEGHPLPVWMVDLETSEIVYESPAAAQLVGREWPSRTPIYATDHFADPDERDAVNAELFKEGLPCDFEVRLKKTDGTAFWASLNDRLITYRGRKVRISSFFDLTARRESERELVRQRELLHQSEKLSALGGLLAGVSHELNNPLSVLVGQALMLKQKATDKNTSHRAELIGQAADRCARIVKTFLAMARDNPSERTPVDLNELIANTLELTAYSLRSSGVDVSLRLADDLPSVMADADQLSQVLTNLVVNAEHALQEVEDPRRLKISTFCRADERQIVVKVEDNGPGIPADIRSRIFEPLFTTKEPGRGTGIGLALCHRLVEAHGGTIELESRAGPGATFAITLSSDHQEDGAVAAPTEPQSRGDCSRILVVDDEPEVGQIIRDILEHNGNHVEVVVSAHAALELIKRRDYDIVLSDVRMPGMDGAAFYRALREVKPEQIEGLAFITGDTLSRRVREFLDWSERPYLEKPITIRDACEVVDLLMRRRRL